MSKALLKTGQMMSVALCLYTDTVMPKRSVQSHALRFASFSPAMYRLPFLGARQHKFVSLFWVGVYLDLQVGHLLADFASKTVRWDFYSELL